MNTIPLPCIYWYHCVTSVSHRAHPHDSSSGSRYITGYYWRWTAKATGGWCSDRRCGVFYQVPYVQILLSKYLHVLISVLVTVVLL